MIASQFSSWLNLYLQQDWVHKERRLLVLQGEQSWASNLLKGSLVVNNERACLIYGDSDYLPANVSYKRFRDKLGSECQFLIFSDSQFNFDAFAALSGTLRAGGVLFLLMPPASAYIDSHFINRFLRYIEGLGRSVILSQYQEERFFSAFKFYKLNSPVQKQLNSSANIVTNPARFPCGCVTLEQLQAVQCIEKVLKGHRKRPLVITADRGRGKSSALAIACAKALSIQLQKHGELRIVITAPTAQALGVFFKQLTESLPDGQVSTNSMQHKGGTVEFIPVDQLLATHTELSLLLVDEAAVIPVFVLEKLLDQYHRMVFSSTVHGYEGAGRGFTLKFKKILSNKTPNWQNFHIKEPIRWCEGDPLETFVYEIGLLNAKLNVLAENQITGLVAKENRIVFRQVVIAELLKNEPLLAQIFAILVTAHYQTKPSDLKMLLDNDQVLLFCVFSSSLPNAMVLGVALILQEGLQKKALITRKDIEAVKNAKRRLKNNFLPQSLLTHCGFDSAFDYQYFRVMRIAIHPQLQCLGVGSLFLQQIYIQAKELGADFIGATFGANKPLLSFWYKNNFEISRLGFTKDKASGEHSALVVRALSLRANKPLRQLNEQFYRSFDHLLLDEFKYLSADLVGLLLAKQPKKNLPSLTKIDLDNIDAFVQGQRLYSSCVYSLFLWFKVHLTQIQCLDQRELSVIICRLLQKRSIPEVCHLFALSGKKALNQTIIDYVNQHI